MNKKVTMVIIIPQKRTYKPLLNEFRERLEEYPLTKRKHEEKTGGIIFKKKTSRLTG